MLLGGQSSQTLIFMQHVPSHTGVAVNLIEIRFQPKVLLFTDLRPELLQNIAIYRLWEANAPNHH